MNDDDNWLWGLFWWFVVGGIGSFAAFSNFGPEYATAGCVVATALLFLFVAYRPLHSSFKSMMLSSLGMAAAIAATLSTLYVVALLGWAAISGKFMNEGLKAIDWVGLLGPIFIASGSYAALTLFWYLMSPERSADRVKPRRDPLKKASSKPSEGQGSDRRDREGARAAPPPPASPSPPRVWWEILGVDNACTTQEADKAAKELLNRYHPDKHQSLPPELQHAAKDMTMKIIAARDAARARQLG